MAAADVNGITIEYECHGDGEPLLLVMGLAGQLVAWPMDWVNRFVDRGYRVIRFDNRDIGLSTKVEGFAHVRRELTQALVAPRSADAPYRLGDMADDAAGLLDHLGVERAHVVGVSMGGMISQSLAIRHPARVASLTSIMSNTGDHVHGLPKPGIVPRLLRAHTRRPDEFVDKEAALFKVIAGPHYDEAEVRQIAKEALARHFDVDGPARQLLAILASPDRTADLRRLDVPTLVIHGLVDPLVRFSGGVATARAIPGARLLAFGDMGHDLPRPRWDEIVEAIVANTRRAVAPREPTVEGGIVVE